MNLNIKTIKKVNDAANFLARSILKQLQLNKKILWFVTGGSSIVVAVEAAKLIALPKYQNLRQNLTVMLTDERYGPLNHKDSNWQQLLEKGFKLPQAKLIPILTGESREVTTVKFNTMLKKELTQNDYIIGLFGIGADGHTAGILPESQAVDSEDLAYGYHTTTFERITITFKTIEQLDEAIVFVQGEEKKPAIENLSKELKLRNQPVQIFKKVPLLTIFTKYK